MVTVSTALPLDTPVMMTGLVEPKLSVGASTDPTGDDAMVAVSVTLPVNPPLGVTVIVEVLPVTAPGLTVREVAVTMYVAGMGAIWMF